MKYYNSKSIDDIVGFIILGVDEKPVFDDIKVSGIGIIQIGNEFYMHGVKYHEDDYVEDVYLELETLPI